MATFQVVAVYPSGNRYPVRGAHDGFIRALCHRAWCERDADPRDPWTYEVDMTRADGSVKRNVDGVADLGYAPEELADLIPGRS